MRKQDDTHRLGRAGLPEARKRAIQKRVLSVFKTPPFGTRKKVMEVLGASKTTVDKWYAKGEPVGIDLVWLIAIGERAGISLDFLVHGTRPKRIGAPEEEQALVVAVGAYVAEQVRLRVGVAPSADGQQPPLSADGDKLLDCLVLDAVTAFNAHVARVRELRPLREAAIRAGADLEKFRRFLPPLISAAGPGGIKELTTELALVEKALADGLRAGPLNGVTAPDVWFTTAAEAEMSHVFGTTSPLARLHASGSPIESLLRHITLAGAEDGNNLPTSGPKSGPKKR